MRKLSLNAHTINSLHFGSILHNSTINPSLKPLWAYLPLLVLMSLFCLIPSMVSAQSDWLEGEITTSEGETITGTVQNRNWKDHIEYVNFRPAGTFAETRYQIKDLADFKIRKSAYLVREITFNNSPREIGNLVRRELQEEQTLKGALYQLTSGPLNLYEYTSVRGNRHYFINKGAGPLRYLPYSVYLKKGGNDADAVQRSKEYTFQLNDFLGKECPGLLTQISNVKYERKALVRLVNSYYECIDYLPTDNFEKERPELAFGVSVGSHYLSQTSETLGGSPAALNFEAPDGFGFFAGGFAKLYLNNSRALALRGGLWFHQLTFKETSSQPSTNILIESFKEQEFSEQFLVGKVGLEFAIVPAKNAIYLSFGAAVNHALSWEEKRWIFSRRTDTDEISGTPRFYDLSGETVLGPYAGLNVNFSKLGIGVEADYYSDRLPGIQLRGVRVSLSANYIF